MSNEPDDRGTDVPDVVFDATAVVAYATEVPAATELVDMIAEDDTAILHIPMLCLMDAYTELRAIFRPRVEELVNRDFMVDVTALDPRMARIIGCSRGDSDGKRDAGLLHAAFVATLLGCEVATTNPQGHQLVVPLARYRVTDLSADWDDVDPPVELT